MGLVGSRLAEAEPQANHHHQREFASANIKNCQPYLSPIGAGGCGGSLNSSGTTGSQHTRTGSVRGAPRQPMPDAQELERRFTKVLVSRLFSLSRVCVLSFCLCICTHLSYTAVCLSILAHGGQCFFFLCWHFYIYSLSWLLFSTRDARSAEHVLHVRT